MVTVEEWERIDALTCGEATNLFNEIRAEIEASADDNMKSMLQGYDNCVEPRSDFNDCQKTVRRKMIIKYWLAAKPVAV